MSSRDVSNLVSKNPHHGRFAVHVGQNAARQIDVPARNREGVDHRRVDDLDLPRQVLVRDVLRGVKAADLMSREVLSVSPDATVEEIVERVVLPTGMTNLPVLENSRLVGLLGLREIQAVERSRWSQVRAREIMRRDVLGQVVSPEEDATRLLSMVVSDDTLIPVMDGESLVGIVTRPELMRRLKLRMELPSA